MSFELKFKPHVTQVQNSNPKTIFLKDEFLQVFVLGNGEGEVYRINSGWLMEISVEFFAAQSWKWT